MSLLLSCFQHNFIESIRNISYSSVPRCSSKMVVNSAISSPAPRALSLSSKGKAYQVQFFLFGCATWPVRVFDETMLAIFDSDCIRCFLHVRRRECVSTVKLWHRLRHTHKPEQFFPKKAPPIWSRCETSYTLPCTWRGQTGGQLRKEDVGPLSESSAAHELAENFPWARPRLSCLGRLYPARSQFHECCQFKNAAASKKPFTICQVRRWKWLSTFKWSASHQNSYINPRH